MNQNDDESLISALRPLNFLHGITSAARKAYCLQDA